MHPRAAPRSLPQTIGGALLALLSGGVISVLLYRTLEVPYELLSGPLGPNEAVRTIERLEALNADYRFEPGGMISVPRSEAAYLRLELGRFGVRDMPETRPAAPLPDRLETKLVQWSLVVLLGMAAAWFVLSLRTLYRGLKRKNAASGGAAEILPSLPPDAEATLPAEELSDNTEGAGAVDAPELALLIQEEHPQIVAVYLLSLKTGRAAAVLEAMAPGARDEIWRRMATLAPCDETLREKVAALFDAKAAQRYPGSRPAFEKAVAVFGRLSPGVRRELLLSLPHEDALFCRQVLPQLLKTEDLLLVDRETWAKITAPFSAREIKEAFPTAAEAFTERFFATMATTETVEETSPAVDSADVRQRLLSRAKKMAAQGTLHWAAE